jgi:hypothetical protein
MDLIITLSLVAVAFTIAGVFAWLGARPYDPMKGNPMRSKPPIPYQFLMLLFAALGLVLLPHVLTLINSR